MRIIFLDVDFNCSIISKTIREVSRNGVILWSKDG